MPSARAGLWAVVPVKLFAETKQRLAPILDADERAALAGAMLRDVLSALLHSGTIEGVLVVTADSEAQTLARDAGALVLPDNENAGTSAAVAQAARHLAASGSTGMLVVPADVPLIRPADIDRIVAAHRDAPAVTIVPASMDGGTNALACSPPDAIAFQFGDESFERHCQAARARGIEPRIVLLPRVGHDIDRPHDLAHALMRGSSTDTNAWLSARAVIDRLRHPVVSP